MNTARRKNIQRIQALHTALRHTACGACPPAFAHLTLGSIANELMARIEVEHLALQLDVPTSAHFVELVGKKMDDLMEKGKAVVRDLSRKESRPEGHNLN